MHSVQISVGLLAVSPFFVCMLEDCNRDGLSELHSVLIPRALTTRSFIPTEKT